MKATAENQKKIRIDMLSVGEKFRFENQEHIMVFQGIETEGKLQRAYYRSKEGLGVLQFTGVTDFKFVNGKADLFPREVHLIQEQV